MAIDFFNNQCQQVSSEKIFGLCDEEGTQKPAYIDVIIRTIGLQK